LNSQDADQHGLSLQHHDTRIPQLKEWCRWY
jgi:hypothetical protein